MQRREVAKSGEESHNLEIFSLIKQLCNNRESRVHLQTLEQKTVEKGFLLSDLIKAIQLYKGFSQLMEDGEYITLVQ